MAKDINRLKVAKGWGYPRTLFGLSFLDLSS